MPNTDPLPLAERQAMEERLTQEFDGDDATMFDMLRRCLDEIERLTQRIELLREELSIHATHLHPCPQWGWEAYDPQRGWKHHGHWTKALPACTCRWRALVHLTTEDVPMPQAPPNHPDE